MFKRLLALGLAAALPLVAACGSGSPDEITISLVPSVEGQDLAEALGPLTAYLSDNHKETPVSAITMNMGLKPINCI